jgi:multidrug efflux pump subunit AcrB
VTTPHERISGACDISIRRACGFAVLAIFTTMVGMSYHPLVAIRVGAAAISLMTAILLVKGWRAPIRPYKQTEAWLILGKRHDLIEDRAQHTIGMILRERYYWHATASAAVALPMWMVDLFLTFFGRGPLPN